MAKVQKLLKQLRSKNRKKCDRAKQELLGLRDPAVLDDLIEALKVQYIQKIVILAVAGFNDPRVPDALLPFTNDLDDYTAQIAIEAMGKLKEQRAVDSIIRRMERRTTPHLRKAAVVALGQIKDPRGLTFITDSLGDEDLSVREAAMTALKGFDYTIAKPCFADAMKKRSPYACEAALEMFALMKDQQALPLIVNALGDSNSSIKSKARMVLGEFDNPVDVFKELLDNGKSVDDRKEIIKALSKWDDPGAIALVISALGDKSKNVNELALWLLKIMRHAKTGELLLEAIDSKKANIRKGALEALIERNDYELIDALAKSLKNNDIIIQEMAFETLKKLKGPKIVALLVQALDSKDQQIQIKALETLCKSGDKSAVPFILKKLNDSELEIRVNAVRALGELGDQTVVATLIELLQDKEPDLRAASAQSLGKLGDPVAVASLAKLLDDSDKNVRYNAVYSLGQFGDNRAIEPLINYLENGCASAVAELLGSLGDERAVMPLIDAYQTEASYLVLDNSEIIKALIRLKDSRSIDLLMSVLRDEFAIFTKSLLYNTDKPSQVLDNVNCNEPLDDEAYVNLDEQRYLLDDIVEILGEFNNAKTIEPMMDLLETEHIKLLRILKEGFETECRLATARFNHVEASINRSLQQILKNQSPDYIISLMKGYDYKRRIKVIEQLALINDECVVEPLITALGDKSEQVNCAACDALRKMDKSVVEKRLYRALGDKNPVIRKDAAGVLNWQEKSKRFDIIKGSIDDFEELCYLHEPKTFDALVDVYETSKIGDELRSEIITTLGELSYDKAQEYIIKALSHKSSVVREAAAKALGGINE